MRESEDTLGGVLLLFRVVFMALKNAHTHT